MQQHVLLLRRQLIPRRLDLKAKGFTHRIEQGEVIGVVLFGPGSNSRIHRQGRIRDHPLFGELAQMAVNDSASVCLASNQDSIEQLATPELRQCNRGGIGKNYMRLEEPYEQVIDLQSRSKDALGAVLNADHSMNIDFAELALQASKT